MKILPPAKGNCTVVFKPSEYKENINFLLLSGIYMLLFTGPNRSINMEINKLLDNTKMGSLCTLEEN
jgi:hypothetical protein